MNAEEHACPKCEADLMLKAEARLVGAKKKKGKTQLEIGLHCYRCDTDFSALVPLTQFKEEKYS